MKNLALVVMSLTACVDGRSATEPDPKTALPYDAHFVIVPNGYPSPEACIASSDQIFSCLYSLSLCANGRTGLRTGDLITDGAYDMDGSIARATYKDGSTLDFDVDAVADLNSPNSHWVIDTERRWETLQFDTISCE